MSLRQKIIFSIGTLLVGLMVMFGSASPWMRLIGGLAALDSLILHWLWYRCPSCDRSLNWTAVWMHCPHCGAWIDYDAK